MKKVYFHHDVLTVCYTIDSLTEQNIMDNTKRAIPPKKTRIGVCNPQETSQ